MGLHHRLRAASYLLAWLFIGLSGCDVLGPVLDSTPPRLNLSAVSDTVLTQDSVSVQGQAIDHDDVVRVTYRVNGGTEHEFKVHRDRYVRFSGTVAIPAEERVDTITVTAYDAAHNHASSDINVRKDVTGPSIEIQMPDSVLERTDVTVKAVIRDPSGVGSVVLHYADQARNVLYSPDTVAALETVQPTRQGAYPLYLVATDRVGNATTSPSITVYSDQTPPRMLIFAPYLAAQDSGEVEAVVEDYFGPGSTNVPGLVGRVVAVQPDDTETDLWTGASPSVRLTASLPAPAYGQAWTLAAYDQLGNRAKRSTVAFRTTPSEDLTVQGGLACVIGVDGTGHCWGSDVYGELGNGPSYGSDGPALVQGGHTFTQITASESHVCAVDDQGAAWCWGKDWHGQLGNGDMTTQESSSPLAVTGGATFTALAAGDNHTCGLASNGNVYCWGSNSDGQLGAGDTLQQSYVPVRGTARTYASLASSSQYSCAIGTDGNAYCWGSYPGASTSTSTPVAVTNGLQLSRVRAGQDEACAIDEAGAVWCWGQDPVTGAVRSQAAKVDGLGPTTDVSVGWGFVCALGADHVVRCWGANDKD
ncbi:MAG: hypothetical protein P8Z36_07170, partial [Gemmatimonadota bacterium]